MNLLYVGERNRDGFARALHFGAGYSDYSFADNSSESHELIGGSEGLVFVGKQNLVFPVRRGYWKLIDRAEDMHLGILGVLGERFTGEKVTLPKGNHRIQKVIYSCESSKNRTVSFMAEELERFFSMKAGKV